MRRFAGLFQGSYMVGPARMEGFSTQLYMDGGGNTSAFLAGDARVSFYVPEDKSQPAVGLANLIPKSSGDSNDQLMLQFQAVPGAVDRGGRPTEFTWTVDEDSGGTFSDAVGSGTMQLFYFPSRRVPRGAIAGGRLGVAIRGEVGFNDLNSLIW